MVAIFGFVNRRNLMLKSMVITFGIFAYRWLKHVFEATMVTN